MQAAVCSSATGPQCAYGHARARKPRGGHAVCSCSSPSPSMASTTAPSMASSTASATSGRAAHHECRTRPEQPVHFGRRAALLALAPVVLWPANQASAGQSLADTQALAAQIKRDFEEGQYYVTGELTSALYEPDCRFIDPTTNVQGVDKYTAALKILFDGSKSRADLISIKVVDASKIVLRWRLEGVVFGLRIKPYTGTTTYTVNEAGRVSRHEETWDISSLDAFVSTLVPSFGAPPAPPVEQLRAAEA